MNRHYRIGVFDSGVGGLDFLFELSRIMPKEQFYYFADTVNNPYGEKSEIEIEKHLVDIIEGMLLRQVKLVVIACNTASMVYLNLGEKHPLKLLLKRYAVDVVPITSSVALTDLTSKLPLHLAIAATRLTIRSGIYQKLISELVPDCKITEVEAGDWVERVERPLTDSQEEQYLRKKAVDNALSVLHEDVPDVIILACTHFPRLKKQIQNTLGTGCKIIDPALSMAHFVKNLLKVRNLQAISDQDYSKLESILFTNGSESDIKFRLNKMGLEKKLTVRQVDIRSNIAGKIVDVVGYGATGKSLIAYLANKNPARLTVRDYQKNVSKKLVEDFPGHFCESKCGEDYLLGIQNADIIFRSPGVPADLPAFINARKIGVPVMSDIDLFLRDAPGKKIAISGTNGKTSTTILLYNLFDSVEGVNAHMIGNVGRPVLDELNNVDENSVSAIELSSFQLEELHSLPVQVAILLNITPDHLDRHGDMANYIKAKGKILTLLDTQAYAIYNIDSEEIVNELLPVGCKALMMPFSSKRKLEHGAFLDGSDLVLKAAQKSELRITDFVTNKKFVGDHNIENLMASALAAYLLDVPHKNICNILNNFAGVKYRIEHFYTLNNVKYYDDSKGTNPDATLKALAAIKNPIRLIAGGISKGYGFDEIARACSSKVKAAYLFGEIAESFEKSLARLDQPMIAHVCDSLESATKLAASEAKSGEAVLFSPACASPTGEKYYQRGKRFKKALKKLGQNEITNSKLYLKDPLAEG